jgi:large subunit ribosomal protein L32
MTIRMRHTKGHTRNRRAHHSLEEPALTTDKDTGTPHLRHRASSVTGKYKGRQVIDVNKKVKSEKKEVKSEETPKEEKTSDSK